MTDPVQSHDCDCGRAVALTRVVLVCCQIACEVIAHTFQSIHPSECLADCARAVGTRAA